MTFADQALCAEYVLKNKGKLQPKVYGVPTEIDQATARLWLEANGLGIDTLSQEQEKYLKSWQ